MASLEHLFTTNHSPTDDERAGLKENVADYDDKLAAITQKIYALEEQLRSLNEEKMALLEASKPFRRALSPFRQLPEDVVRAIFVACLETRWNPTMAKTEAPVLLTRISRATRMIALTTSALWAAIHIPIITSVKREVMDTAQSIMTARAKGVKEWLLRRSGNLPLHISVYENRAYSGTRNVTSEIIDILTACCSRWKNVYFSCCPTTLSRISSLTQSEVPFLQSLAISPVGYSSDEIHFWRNTEILKSPTLKKFHDSGKGKTLCYPINWLNLTHLSIYCARTMDNLVDVLRQASSLVRLDLTLMVYGFSYPETIPLLCLTTLVVTDLSPPLNENLGIVGAIYAPFLEAISYNAKLCGGSRSPGLIACLKRSPNVRELSTGQPSSTNILVEYLSYCPTLVILHVPGPGFVPHERPIKRNDDSFLREFFRDDAAQCLCPRLEYFRYEPTLLVSLTTLRGFLAYRKVANPPLSRWKAVIMNVEYDRVEEPLIQEIRSSEVAGDIRLGIFFKKPIPYMERLDEGIVRAVSLVDVWWPSALVDDRTYLS
ncbi:hypothetical protein HYPSUDRAFT_41025 [Hypholoma sublateritium FD-334 SS-4]|uniref:F-box domain-containing protein n=1 Tax=Hypholoma sublateritium (strain FD-334 SS-4) TaxID=945553 RepID=A0A0D2PRB9_HYPSF|nr:hypothetical protein HYPSUDRAFT_41025 [Hypholoma sublateritium FD-334 SS-4]